MAQRSTIQWTEKTWNPIRGCSRVSPGCQNCYAERHAARFSDAGSPFHLYAKRTPSGPRWTGKVSLVPKMLDVPLRTRKPTTWFVNSMSDLFHEDLSLADKEMIFRVMLSAPEHTFQVLTKRATLMAEQVPQIMYRIFANHWQVPAHIWLGVSVEDRQRVDRINALRAVDAAVRFISFEPLLEDVGEVDLRGIHWAIIGGESGPGARSMDVEWARRLIAQCRAAGVAPFMKQLGAHPYMSRTADDAFVPDYEFMLSDRKGGTPDEWPEDLRVREYPCARNGSGVK